MATMPIYQVDAFTAKPFAGNPAGVCVLPGPAEDAWMQNVALEMNLSETAFLVKQEDGYNLRWFTPRAEVDLCGHATLASAHMLWELGLLRPGEQARFHTRSGLLTADRKAPHGEPAERPRSKSRGDEGDWIQMDFPATPEVEAPEPDGLRHALGLTPVRVGKNIFDYIVEAESEAVVRAIRPDFGRLAELPVRGVIVTSRASTPGFDFVSRFFAPQVGVNEDPVTGSAHACLGPYWSARLGKTELNAYQASARGGVLRVTVLSERVLISGQAVTVIRGELC